MDYQKDEHRVHLIIYHLIWCPKRRKKVLVGDIAKDLKIMIEAKCEEHDWHVLNLAIASDHVHLFVRTFPTNDAAFVVNQCKGSTSRLLREKYPELRKLPSLWTSSYFASTAGNVSQETIQKYIEKQKGI